MGYKISFLLSIATSLWLSEGYAQYTSADTLATLQTKILYKNLSEQAKTGFMFGHQDDLAYGVGWKNIEGDSDIKRVSGQYPAVFGWDLAPIELDSAKNLDDVSFEKIKRYIIQVHEMGGVNTVTWHMRNPLNGKTAWDVGPVVKHILIGGEKYALYESWLAKAAVFFKSLKDKSENPIPIIFRPFHEHNGSWFWWGKKHCSPEEYKKLYQQMVQYMTDKGVHNLLYAYSPDCFFTESDYFERYPGDGFVDILGLDVYHRKLLQSNNGFVKNLDRMLTAIENHAQKHSKLTAITETGLEKITEPEWWTNVLLKGIGDHKISYVLVWRNAGLDHFYAPYPGQESAENFKKFINHPTVYLSSKMKESQLYKKR
jgi:mannan endo-1,4-beta-mannosidase